MAEETLQFLKREEVRTMAKDIAKLREQEAGKEREHIAKIKTEPAESPKGIQADPPQSKGLGGEPKPSLMPHEEKRRIVLPKARTRFQKVFIRVVIIGVLLFVVLNGLAFGYWYFTKKRVVEITPSPQPSPEASAGEAEPGNGNQVPSGNLVSQLQPTPDAAAVETVDETRLGETRFRPSQNPVMFFETLQEKTIDLNPTDSLIALLSGALKEEYPQGFTRLLIKHTENAASLTTREFLEKASVAMPEPLLSLLKEDFMLFVYSSPGRKRLGLIGELSQTEGVQDMLRSWETTLEQDTKALWEIIGQKGSAYTPFFRQAAYQNSQVRFQTFSVIDFGVVYTLFGDKLVLTTSFESLTKAVNQIIQSRQ